MCRPTLEGMSDLNVSLSICRILEGEKGFAITEALLDQTERNSTSNNSLWYYMDDHELLPQYETVCIFYHIFNSVNAHLYMLD